MKTTGLTSLALACATILCIATASMTAQAPTPIPSVWLQSPTPGTAQAGSANITGTLTAGAVNASSFRQSAAVVRGANSASQFSSIGVLGEILNEGPSSDHGIAVQGINRNYGIGGYGVEGLHYGSGVAVRGYSSGGPGIAGTSGTGIGGVFESISSSGMGIYAVDLASSGDTIGVKGQVSSNTGIALYGLATNSSGQAIGVRGTVLGTGGIGVSGIASATSGTTLGVSGIASSSEGRGVFGYASSLSGLGVGGYFVSDCADGEGLYAEAYGLSAVHGVATKPSGSTYGGKFQSNSTDGTAVYGETVGLVGGNFVTSNQSGRAVYGLASAAGGLNYGGYFKSNSAQGYGVYSETAGPWAVYALSTNTSVVSYGGLFFANGPFSYGVSASSQGPYGVQGVSQIASGTAYGGFFQSASSSGRGVYGYATVTAASATPYGVRGEASTATLGYGVYAAGDIGASGTKSFRIDHPFDPENKYLLHYSSESPFPQDFYNGNVVTDSGGYAWVDLPDYFEAINTNFKYQLTVVDESDTAEFVWAKVVEKIKTNRFRIRTNLPHVEVSWMVFADRNDKRVQFNKPTDVRDKTGNEKGRVEHPEYYGLEHRMAYDQPAIVPARGKTGQR